MSECSLMDKNADEARRGLVLRLKRVEGQLRGIQHMLESGADCEEIALLGGILVSTLLTLVVIPILYYAANFRRLAMRPPASLPPQTP